MKFSYMFLFYFVRQLYSVIYDMNCGCDVMSAASVQLTPKTLTFPANLNIAGVFVFHSPICGSTHTCYFISKRYNLNTKTEIQNHTHTKRNCYNSNLPVYCKANCPSFPVSYLKTFL